MFKVWQLQSMWKEGQKIESWIENNMLEFENSSLKKYNELFQKMGCDKHASVKQNPEIPAVRDLKHSANFDLAHNNPIPNQNIFYIKILVAPSLDSNIQRNIRWLAKEAP